MRKAIYSIIYILGGVIVMLIPILLGKTDKLTSILLGLVLGPSTYIGIGLLIAEYEEKKSSNKLEGLLLTKGKEGVDSVYIETLQEGYKEYEKMVGYSKRIKKDSLKKLVGELICLSSGIFEHLVAKPRDVTVIREFFTLQLVNTNSILELYLKLQDSGLETNNIIEKFNKTEESIKRLIELYKHNHETLLDQDILALEVKLELMNKARDMEELIK